METVDLPVQPPIDPILAKAATTVPDDAGVWSYEPKWDGFLHWTCQANEAVSIALRLARPGSVSAHIDDLPISRGRRELGRQSRGPSAR